MNTERLPAHIVPECRFATILPKGAVIDLEEEKQILQTIMVEEEAKGDKKAKVGAKSLYTPFILPRIEYLAANGLNNRQLAQCLGICDHTFYEWMKEKPQFAHTVKKYRGLADIQVENALFKSAVGYKIKETKQERVWNRNTQSYEMVLTEVQEKKVLPNTAAQIFYLKNRMPHRYKDKVETEISLGSGIESLAFAIKRREE